jgi:hypothetical protein
MEHHHLRLRRGSLDFDQTDTLPIRDKRGYVHTKIGLSEHA